MEILRRSILINIMVCSIFLFHPNNVVARDKRNDQKSKVEQNMSKDQKRDKATKAKPLHDSQTVHRYTRFKKDLQRDIKPGEHMTSDAKPGRPPSGEKAKSMFGLPTKPKYRGTIKLEKEQPVKQNKVIGGDRGLSEKTSTKPIPKENVQKIIKLPK